MNVISTRLQDRICALRHSRGLTREQLAAKLTEFGFPTTTATVGYWETHRRKNVTVDELVALSGVFGTTPALLLGSSCFQCHGAPPAGFTCNGCGATSTDWESDT